MDEVVGGWRRLDAALNKGGLVKKFWWLVEVQTTANLTNLASRFPDGPGVVKS